MVAWPWMVTSFPLPPLAIEDANTVGDSVGATTPADGTATILQSAGYHRDWVTSSWERSAHVQERC